MCVWGGGGQEHTQRNTQAGDREDKAHKVTAQFTDGIEVEAFWRRRTGKMKRGKKQKGTHI